MVGWCGRCQRREKKCRDCRLVSFLEGKRWATLYFGLWNLNAKLCWLPQSFSVNSNARKWEAEFAGEAEDHLNASIAERIAICKFRDQWSLPGKLGTQGRPSGLGKSWLWEPRSGSYRRETATCWGSASLRRTLSSSRATSPGSSPHWTWNIPGSMDQRWS